jgi:hypothetical protein
MKNFHNRAWLLFLVGMVVGVVLYIAFASLHRPELVVGWVAGCWALTHFLHQHYLARARFFSDLFNRFNERYDKINDRLAEVAEATGMLSAEDRALVVDYFNLCAEEYVFYVRGYLDLDVWRSWANGMKWYGSKERMLKVWREEKATDSYYGFDLERL